MSIDIFNFKFITLIIALILSIDRFANAYDSLVNEYSKVNEMAIDSIQEELCIKENITFGSIRTMIINCFVQIIIIVAVVFHLVKALSIRRKIAMILGIALSPIIAYCLVAASFLVSIILEKGLGGALNYIFYKLEFCDSGIEGFFCGIVQVIFKIIGVIIYLRVLIFCYKGTLGSVSAIKYELKSEKNLSIIKKEIGILFINIIVLDFLFIIPFSIFKGLLNNIIGNIFMWILYIDFFSYILAYCLCVIINKIHVRLKKYKEDE